MTSPESFLLTFVPKGLGKIAHLPSTGLALRTARASNQLRNGSASPGAQVSIVAWRAQPTRVVTNDVPESLWVHHAFHVQE